MPSENLLVVLGWIVLTLSVVSLGAVFAKRRHPEILVGLFAAAVVMVPAFGSKPTVFGPFVVNAPIVVFAASFLLTDMLSEFFGKEYAYRAVLTGFLAGLIFVITAKIAIVWNAPLYWPDQAAFEVVFGPSLRIMLGSFLAYLVAQVHDVWAYDFWKRKTKGKHLWLRNNASTMASQVLDSAIFLIVAFYGILPLWDLFVGFVVIKFLIALLDTPFMYAVRWYYNSRFSIDFSGKLW